MIGLLQGAFCSKYQTAVSHNDSVMRFFSFPLSISTLIRNFFTVTHFVYICYLNWIVFSVKYVNYYTEYVPINLQWIPI